METATRVLNLRMGVVGFLARAELRRRRGSVLLLTLLVGLVGAVVLASAAGARRSGSSLQRFEQASRSPTEVRTCGPVPWPR